MGLIKKHFTGHRTSKVCLDGTGLILHTLRVSRSGRGVPFAHGRRIIRLALSVWTATSQFAAPTPGVSA